MSSIKKRLVDALRFVLVGNPWSYDFEVDGIYYSRNGSDATVTAGKNHYSGSVVVPASVTHKDKTYRVTAIGEGAFENCRELTDVVLPDSTVRVGNYAFERCTALASIVIGKNVSSFGERVFAKCPNLKSVTLRSESIVGARYNWIKNVPTLFGAKVREYIIGEGVTVIGRDAFYGCFDIKSLTISGSVKKIGNGAFSGCMDLTDITCLSETPPTIEGDIFIRVPMERAILRVPASAVETYKATAPWSGFGTIMPV